MKAWTILPMVLALAACSPKRPPVGVQGDPERGKIAVTQYACQSCHLIPGVPGSKVYVGRPLSDMARRKLLAGALPADQAGLVRWIRDPQSVDPDTAMPNMGVSERDALDISAYLLTR
ncbi:c-type cytochrome [Massilia sp. LjRoot122]|uniref:c-type cytochrome n=1 Tax=Massilia sp. LjRoot122 TaxID=3342257 RepID=UPI003ECF77DC